jgi:hypothetical protein
MLADFVSFLHPGKPKQAGLLGGGGLAARGWEAQAWLALGEHPAMNRRARVAGSVRLALYRALLELTISAIGPPLTTQETTMRPGIDPNVDYAFTKLFGSESNLDLLSDVLYAILQPGPGRHFVDLAILNPFNEKDTT